MFTLKASFVACSVALTALAASFPPKPEEVTVVQSTKFPGVSISFKETSICETTEGIKGYSGYVNLPPDPAANRNYPAHMYFWFFQAREDHESAPLSAWFSGGPGVPSTSAALGEHGPCKVLEDSKTTELNSWSWTNNVNMLYIDQPVQVGYSYDTLVNGTLDEVASPFQFKPADFSQTGVPETNLTFLTGTFPSGKLANAPNTTMAAAPFIYDFMQAWIQEFPLYKSIDNRFSIWGQSYGGHYVPIYADYFEQQNDKIANGSAGANNIGLYIDTVGLINACIDIDVQMIKYPEYANNNTYGKKLITQEQYDHAIASSPTCKNMTATCRSLAAQKDPNGVGNQPDVNAACKGAFDYCFTNMHDFYGNTGPDKYDIAAPGIAQVFPPKWAAGYLNDAETQQALGVPLNWTGTAVPVAVGFDRSGDFILGNGLGKLGSLLDRGVKVALLYGDRDFQCNWFGGEAISTAIKSKGTSDFAAAGYTSIETNASYIGGFVRQHGNLSFSRVFQAGHSMPFYQPETAYQIFNRVMFNRDVATGKELITSNYATTGPSEAWTPSRLPSVAEIGIPQCYLWDVLETCTPAQGAILLSGKAIVEEYILVGVNNGTSNATMENPVHSAIMASSFVLSEL